jgi:titin
LVVNRFRGWGIDVEANDTVLVGNYIGTDLTGTQALGNGTGIYIVRSASNTMVGGTATGAGNLISGNSFGIEIIGSLGIDNVVVQGNYIGTDATGTHALGNGTGIYLQSASNTTVGGMTAGAGNLISGNLSKGILSGGDTGTLVQGNHIGTDVTGTHALGNGSDGVAISGPNDLVGGTAAGAGNLIAGNGGNGVTLGGPSGNVVQGNKIGTDITGTYVLGNNGFGIHIFHGINDLVGGTAAGAGNLIAGNVLGIRIDGDSNVVQGNKIGTDATGTQALGNVIGVATQGSNNLVGGTAAGAGNLIAGNSSTGVEIGPGSGNVVQGNYIGTDATGTQPLGNGLGVNLIGSNNLLGGTVAGTGNLIAFSGGDGVLVQLATGDAIRGNAIFANAGVGIRLFGHGNHDQEAPVLTAASSNGANTTVVGTLASAPNTRFVLEFFSNIDCGRMGSCQGETFLGSLEVTTDEAGQVDFTAVLDGVDPGQFITATATDPGGNTSPFSNGLIVNGSAPGRPAVFLLPTAGLAPADWVFAELRAQIRDTDHEAGRADRGGPTARRMVEDVSEPWWASLVEQALDRFSAL